jgi:hypothetical protein
MEFLGLQWIPCYNYIGFNLPSWFQFDVSVLTVPLSPEPGCMGFGAIWNGQSGNGHA